MAAVRRHWRSFLIQVVLVAVIVALWAAMPPEVGSRARAQDTLKPGVTSASADGDSRDDDSKLPGVDPVIYSQVQQLREDLALTSQDLAAMGCTGEQAASVLERLKTWVEQNQAQLEAGQRAQREAQRELREAYQKMHVGPRDESVVRSIPTLEQGVERALVQHQSVQNGVATQVASLLNGDQRLVWDRAKANASVSGGLPGAYRYAAGVTKDQAQKLDAALRNRSEQDKPDRVERSGAISSGQLRQAQEAHARLRQHIEAVLDAEAKVLPPPEELTGAALPPVGGDAGDIPQPSRPDVMQ